MATASTSTHHCLNNDIFVGFSFDFSLLCILYPLNNWCSLLSYFFDKNFRNPQKLLSEQYKIDQVFLNLIDTKRIFLESQCFQMNSKIKILSFLLSMNQMIYLLMAHLDQQSLLYYYYYILYVLTQENSNGNFQQYQPVYQETNFDQQSVKNQVKIQPISIQQRKKGSQKIKKPRYRKKKSRKIKKKDLNFSQKTQHLGRNQPSIVLRNFFFYVNNHPFLEKEIQLIRSKNNISLSAQFFSKQMNEILIQKSKSKYIGKKSVKQTCFSNLYGKQFGLVFRILIRKYLKLQAYPSIYKGHKQSKQFKKIQIKNIRKVYNYMFENQNQQDRKNQENHSSELFEKNPQQNIEIKLENQTFQKKQNILKLCHGKIEDQQ